jgi:hypothetical protein
MQFNLIHILNICFKLYNFPNIYLFESIDKNIC